MKHTMTDEERRAVKRAYNLAYKTANREKIRAAARRYYWETKETRREAMRANYTRQNRKRPALERTKNEAALGRKRPGACEVCGGNDGGIVFDHCHQKGHARGWLCDRCNCALGFLKDDISRLRKLIAYLERNRTNTAPQLTLIGI
jgi:Autographiviridae endonuclease VII